MTKPNKKTIILPAMFDNLTHRKDGSVNVKFDTRELSGEEIVMLLGFRNTEGWLQFSQNNEEFIPPPEDNARTDLPSPSELQRDALYVLYKDEPRTETFQTFYATQMEQIRQAILKKVKK